MRAYRDDKEVIVNFIECSGVIQSRSSIGCASMNEIQSLESALQTLLASALKEKGYMLVRIKLMVGGRYLTLQVMAERSDLKPITVQDCVTISHIATARLDAQKVPSEIYTLEITAPGLDRPLVQLEDFERYTGQMAVVDLRAPVEGQQRFLGKIVRVNNHEPSPEIELNTSQGSVRVPVKRIAEARLSTIQEAKVSLTEGKS